MGKEEQTNNGRQPLDEVLMRALDDQLRQLASVSDAAERVRLITAGYEAAHVLLDRWLDARSDAVGELFVSGMPKLTIAKRTGLSRQRVQQILRSSRRHGDADADPT